MLLFALSLDGFNEQKRAIEARKKAQHTAIDLEMNQLEYAIINRHGSPVCEESLRRT
jgi:hypothetical protein